MSEGSHCEDPNGVQGAIEISLPLPGSPGNLSSTYRGSSSYPSPSVSVSWWWYVPWGYVPHIPRPYTSHSLSYPSHNPHTPYPIPEFDPFSVGFRQGMGGMTYWPIPSFGDMTASN